MRLHIPKHISKTIQSPSLSELVEQTTPAVVAHQDSPTNRVPLINRRNDSAEQNTTTQVISHRLGNAYVRPLSTLAQTKPGRARTQFLEQNINGYISIQHLWVYAEDCRANTLILLILLFFCHDRIYLFCSGKTLHTNTATHAKKQPPQRMIANVPLVLRSGIFSSLGTVILLRPSAFALLLHQSYTLIPHDAH